MIRPFTVYDADRCREIFHDCFEALKGIEAEEPRVFIRDTFTAKDYLESRLIQYHLFVLEENQEIIAIGGVDGDKIKKLYVDPRAQRKGFGRQLLQYLEDAAKILGNDETVTFAIPSAVDFYKKQGYHVVGPHIKQKDDIVIKLKEMRKKL